MKLFDTLYCWCCVKRNTEFLTFPSNNTTVIQFLFRDPHYLAVLLEGCVFCCDANKLLTTKLQIMFQ